MSKVLSAEKLDLSKVLSAKNLHLSNVLSVENSELSKFLLSTLEQFETSVGFCILGLGICEEF